MENEWFGEWVIIENDDEKEEAYQYLKLWKKFLLRRFPGMESIGEDMFIERSTESMDFLSTKTLGIKFEVTQKLNNLITD